MTGSPRDDQETCGKLFQPGENETWWRQKDESWFQASFCLGVMESEDRQKGKPTRDPSEVATTEMDQEWPWKGQNTHTYGSRYSDQM